MEPVSEITVHHGDSRDVLKGLADASVHAVVCDPPYALVSIGKRFGADNAAASKPGKTGAYARASAGFMGQKWDTGETAFAVEFWAEVYRVLKPGGHVVAFSATRTYHRLACAIEDAGFEIRDMVAWLYGSGFPKSHDVSKGIDKRQRGGLVSAKLLHFAELRGIDGAWLETQGVASAASFRDWTVGGHVPSDANWQIIKTALGVTPDEEAAFEREVVAAASNGIASGTGRHAGAEGSYGFRRQYEITTSATSAARAWEGWGTALKPALEPIVFARKPLDGTVAANVLAYGVGALNIDACRIEGEPVQAVFSGAKGGNREAVGGAAVFGDSGKYQSEPHSAGRWPANVIHDGSPEVVEAFPANAGAFAPVRGTEESVPAKGDVVYGFRERVPHHHHGDSGSAARFFYSAKADAEDRLGSKHPTVKPIDLMAWLCRLVTPPGGVILDPFAGTGTTGLAAMREGFDCILIEREAQYVADINRRLAWARGEGRLTAQETGKAKADAIEDLPLFAPSEGLTPIGPVVAKVAAQVLDKALDRDQDQGEAA